MNDITFLGKQQNGPWLAFAYDLHSPFGYETMLSVFDKFISSYHVRVTCIAKARIAGQNHTVVWKKNLFNRLKSLSEIPALKEECGEVAIGGQTNALDGMQFYMTLVNQTSMVTIQVPTKQFSEKNLSQIDDIARSLQT